MEKILYRIKCSECKFSIPQGLPRATADLAARQHMVNTGHVPDLIEIDPQPRVISQQEIIDLSA